MGDIKKFTSENLIIGVLASNRASKEDIERVLEQKFGKIDFVSDILDFNFTSYYDEEMGSDIKRWFYSFESLVEPTNLPEIKILTNEIELQWAVEGDRKVNIDPGLLDLNRLILATTKNVGHRIPLQDGIYGEVTLLYMKKGFSCPSLDLP